MPFGELSGLGIGLFSNNIQWDLTRLLTTVRENWCYIAVFLSLVNDHQR